MVSVVLGYVYVLGGASEQLYLLDETTGQVVDSLYVGSTGDVPNFVYLPGRNLTAGGQVGIVINSGGFYGYPSLVYFEPVVDSILSEYPLPDSLNPMEGVVIGDTLYFTNYGKDGQGAAVYLFYGGTLVDSIEVGLKPIGMKYCFDRILVASLGGYLYSINPADRSKDSLYLGATTSQVGCDSQYVYVLATGTYGNDDAVVYRVDGAAFTYEGESQNFGNSYVMAVGNENIYAASYGGTLYLISRADGSVDSLSLGYSGIMGMDFYDGKLYISAGAWTGGANYVLTYDEQTSTIGSYSLSSDDVGIGFLYAFSVQTDRREGNPTTPFVYRNGTLYFDDVRDVSIYDASGKRIYEGFVSSVNLRRFPSKVLLVRIDGRTYRFVNVR